MESFNSLRSEEQKSSFGLELGMNFTCTLPRLLQEEQPGKTSTVPLKSLLVCSSSGINIPVGKETWTTEEMLSRRNTHRLASSSPLYLPDKKPHVSMAMGKSNSSWGDYS